MKENLTTCVSKQNVHIALYTRIILLNECLHSDRHGIYYLYALQTTPSPSLPLTETNNSTWEGHLTGAGKNIVLLGYLMVNDLFNVEVAETTVVLRKALR